MMCILPVERALSTTFCISQGDRNCPFLMFTGLPCELAATMKFVCRQRNAGVCRTSTTAATSSSGVSSCTSVNTGTPIWSRTLARAFRPPSSPGPRKLAREERFALSNDALKMKGIFERARHLLEAPGHLDHQGLALDDAGTGNQEERVILPGLEGRQLHALMRWRGPAAARREIRAPRRRSPRTTDGHREAWR